MRYSNSPYRKIPEDLVDDYTLSGQVEVKDMYRDESRSGKIRGHSNWDEQIKKYSLLIGDEEKEKETPYGHEVAFTRVRKAMEFAGIYNKKIAIVGSLTPWVETIALHMGCKITTVEYNLPVCTHPDIELLYWDDFCKKEEVYDAVVSFSSIEHSGLGRYGDPLNPRGDLEAVEVIKSKINKKGVFILGIPCGRVDFLVWNCHRVYGPLRLPMLIEGFEEVKRFPRGQPVLVLKKQ